MRPFMRPALVAALLNHRRSTAPPSLSCPSRFTSYPSLPSSFASPTLLAADLAPPPTQLPGVEAGTAAAPSERDLAVERLSFDVFGRGNQHLKNVETLTSLPEGLHSFPEVCFVGKPSCGKSSLISCLLHNRRLAKTGKVRGTTRLLQFFNVGDALLLVDTPGYGGWKGRQVPHRPRERANAFAILFRYLALRKTGNLKRVYWCMEASASSPVALGPRDEEMLTFLQREQIPFTVVLTKIDRHWHYYHEKNRASETVGRDGAPNPAPWVRHYQQQAAARRSEVKSGGEQRLKGQAVITVPTPAEGIRRNMAEICAFLGTPDVPVIGVSANRWHPERCMNLLPLQHDIVDHCTRELRDTASLTYANMHELSYAPPRAEDIERVQLTYPIEAFIVPQDDRLSLQEMVDRHEDAKAHLVARHAARGLLSAKDAAEGFLEDSRALEQAQSTEDHQREALSALPPSLSYVCIEGGAAVPQCRVAETGRAATQVGRDRAPAGTSCTRPKGARFAVRASLRAGPFDTDGWGTCVVPDADEKGERDEGVPLCPTPAASQANTHAKSSAIVDSPSVSVASSPAVLSVVDSAGSSPTRPTPIPFSLDRDSQTVAAINGVRIPRSLVPSSVEDLAIEKEDEMSAFAAKSGAGAYEEMMISDRLHPSSPQALTFMECGPGALLPESVLDSATQRVQTRSAARKQEERMLAKYVDRDRKERSIYMQAEGYMCPWVGQGSSTPSAQGTVMGLASAAHAPTGRSGALMRGLKQSGFGGNSYSARTLRGKGRSTKKTGSWAA